MGLRLVMAEDGKAAIRKRALPPVSKATGGPMPWLDLKEVSFVAEIEDLDHIARMQRFK
jgi:hypothetical protein